MNVSLDFCRKLPKVEVHAHINGSASAETINKLVELKRKRHPSWGKDGLWSITVQKGHKRTLAEIFEMFAIIHQLCDSDEAAYLVTKDVISEFHSDNVRYLELRTTPRSNAETGMTKESYLNSVLKAIQEQQQALPNIIVRLLLSIDRRTTVENAFDTLQLALQLPREIVVGLDLSGDPNKGDATIFIPVFKEAKEAGLKISLHIAEEKHLVSETAPLLKLLPGRVGHATFLHHTEGGRKEDEDMLIKENIPIEICLTSNFKTTVHQAQVDGHQFTYWHPKSHPCILGTDDKGVFATSLSEEFQLAADIYKLNKEELWQLSFSAIKWCFCDDKMKKKLEHDWAKWLAENKAFFKS